MKPEALLAFITMCAAGLNPRPMASFQLNYKERVKSGITRHKPKPGRNHPAKGYDPETKTWSKVN